MKKFKKQFERIYEKYVDKIYRFVFLKVSSSEIAEDLTSQVFLRGWDKFKKQNPTFQIHNVSAYLFQIARSEIANHYRQKPKFQTISTESKELLDFQLNPEESQSLNSDFIEIRKAISLLPEESQNMIVLRYVNGLSNREIAKILDKSEGTIRVALHRSLKELRERLL